MSSEILSVIMLDVFVQNGIMLIVVGSLPVLSAVARCKPLNSG